jgi:hypothetical protein
MGGEKIMHCTCKAEQWGVAVGAVSFSAYKICAQSVIEGSRAVSELSDEANFPLRDNNRH